MNPTAKPTVAVLGASQDRRKYGNKSVRAHAECGYEVFPINPNAAEVEGWKAYASLAEIPVDRLDRITVYLPPPVGLKMLDAICGKPAGQVWFNPGSESEDLIGKARERGLRPIIGCSIVDLGVSPGQFPDE
jgi:predicted CoA-binding protein